MNKKVIPLLLEYYMNDEKEVKGILNSADLIIEEKEKKGLTWIANSVMVKSNPSDKGKLKVALIEAERVPYKGFSNLLWKSVMSGMVNTINPVGKTVKREKKHNRNKEKKDWEKWFTKS